MPTRGERFIRKTAPRAGGGVPAGCECFDRNGDNDVDIEDLAAFKACWTGPNVPWSQDLTPNCPP